MSLGRLRKRVATAVADASLAVPYHAATARARQKRELAVRRLPDWEEQRARAAATRRDALDHLQPLLDHFADRFTAAGGTVHRAYDAAEACEIVTGILRDQDARTIIKGKSMVTEEIGLNAHLELDGFSVWETDLGEYIVQLAGDRPSHIVAPALHMRREDIGRLFAEKLGVEYTDDPQTLTGIARRELRQRFLEADAGITGANFLVAETGQVVMLENEANIRMSTTAPQLHIVVTGIEKIIRDFIDLGPLLTVIARSTTGQSMGAYVSILDGGGPQTRHIVLVDNGRRGILGNSQRREILACIRCGACLNACPVYEHIGGHAYDSTYAGPIGSLLSTHHVGTDDGEALPFASSLCGACEDVCPVKIDIPGLLRTGRERYVEWGGVSVLERLAWWTWARVLERPRLYNILAGMGRGLLRSQSDSHGYFSLLSPWTDGRTLPMPAERRFIEQWKQSGRGLVRPGRRRR